MWGWLDMSSDKSQPMQPVQPVQPVEQVNDDLVTKILDDLYSPEVLKAINEKDEEEKEEKEEKEEEEKEEEEEEKDEEGEAEWEQDLDKKWNKEWNKERNRIYNCLCGKKVKIVMNRNHLIILTVAYFMNIYFFMFHSKCLK